jgi:hypothetical protein
MAAADHLYVPLRPDEQGRVHYYRDPKRSDQDPLLSAHKEGADEKLRALLPDESHTGRAEGAAPQDLQLVVRAEVRYGGRPVECLIGITPHYILIIRKTNAHDYEFVRLIHITAVKWVQSAVNLGQYPYVLIRLLSRFDPKGKKIDQPKFSIGCQDRENFARLIHVNHVLAFSTAYLI